MTFDCENVTIDTATTNFDLWLALFQLLPIALDSSIHGTFLFTLNPRKAARGPSNEQTPHVFGALYQLSTSQMVG